MSRRKYKLIVKYLVIAFGFVIYYKNWMTPSLILKSIRAPYELNTNWRDKGASIIENVKIPMNHQVLKIFEILDDMYVRYPSYIWFYTGWLQDLDVLYDIDQWSVDPLVVHVIPFSHNDPGWLLTYEEYFRYNTKNILDVALKRLKASNEMTFVWSEVCYLKKWFNLISEDDRMDFKSLVKEGRFEVLTGGMVMPDEAIVPYYSLLNVLSDGHLWLKNKLNLSVDTAWSIDSFGHSSTFAHLLVASGINRTFIQRTHYALKRHLAFKRQIEFYWTQSWDSRGLFTHMSPFLAYSMLYACGPDVFICCRFEFLKHRCWRNGAYAKADEITADNLESRSLDLLEMLRKKSQFVNHNNVLLMVGDDFSYDSVTNWDKQWNNMNKMFQYLNSQPYLRVQVKYSTIGRYLRSAEKDVKVETPKLEGDFFPYSDRSNQYWSGYYSTRPNLKSLIRTGQSYLRTVEILLGLISVRIFQDSSRIDDFMNKCNNDLRDIREEFSIFQHHDTITGTSRLGVIKDTKTKLDEFFNSIGNLMAASMSFLSIYRIDTEFLHIQLPLTKPKLLDDKTNQVLQIPIKLVIFNSLAINIKEVLKVYVNSKNIIIINQKRQAISCQMNPAFYSNLEISDSIYEVHMHVELNALSSLELWILDSRNGSQMCAEASVEMNLVSEISGSSKLNNQKSFSMSNDFLEVQFDEGIMKRIITKSNNKSIEINIKYMVYNTDHNFNPFMDKSGAYIFLPNGKPHELSVSIERLVLVEGPVKSFIITKLSTEVVQIIEIVKLPGLGADGLHVTNMVDLSKKGNFEISMVLETPVDNIFFFTDLNGYQMVKRKWRNKFGIQGNFYPMTSTAFIEDSSMRVTLTSDQSHAVTSRNQGDIEVMLDRRLLQDDWRGLREGVEDNTPNTASTFTILVEEIGNHLFDYDHGVPMATEPALRHSMRLDGPLTAMIHRNTTSPLKFMKDLDFNLPCGVHLVSWRVLAVDDSKIEYLITLHYFGLVDFHSGGNSELPCLSKTVRVPASKFNLGYPVAELYEMNLTGTRVKLRLTSGVLQIHQMEIKTWLFISLR